MRFAVVTRARPDAIANTRALLLAVTVVSLAVGNGAVGAQTAKTIPLETGAGPAAWIGDLSPIAASDWNYARAAHLLERAGFGGTPEEIQRLAAMTPAQAVAYLVDCTKIENTLPRFEPSGIFKPGIEPAMSSTPTAEVIALGRTKGEALGIKVENKPGTQWMQPLVQEAYFHAFADRAEAGRVEEWWAHCMLVTKRPLEEKMTLFWHGLFATSSTRVRDYRMMLQQNEMLRRNAVGNYRDLLLGIAKDPAMLVYLDNGLNVKGAPNENFAREIMELFSMGVGNYTEKDIQDAARAFTGWTNDGRNFVVKSALHDTGKKTVLGETGDFDGTELVVQEPPAEAKQQHVRPNLY